ncbi:MAG: hypothetical protein V9H69_20875 [Anaerolineae bacterium]
MTNNTDDLQSTAPAADQRDLKTRSISLIGYILGISYPLLALSTGARGLYQLFLRDDLAKLGPALSVLTAVLYMVAAIGFFKRTARWWRISVGALTVETILVLVIGTLSFIIPDALAHTAWRHLRPGLRLLSADPAAAGPDLSAVEADACGFWRNT